MALTLVSFTPADASASVLPITYADGVYYFGFFRGGNDSAAGKAQVGVLQFRYTGSGTETITMAETNVQWYANDTVAVTRLKNVFTATVKRAASVPGGNPGGGTPGGGNTSGGGSTPGAGTGNTDDYIEMIIDETPISDFELQLLSLFPDIKGHWAEAAIHKAAWEGWVSGYPDGDFRPNASVTRAEFASLLVRAFSLRLLPGAPPLPFADTRNHWASTSVHIAYALHIVYGVDNTRYVPAASITREQAVSMIMRMCDAFGYIETPADGYPPLIFADAGSVAQWARGHAEAAVANGIVYGKSNNLFDPKGTATRAEAVAIIARVLALGE